MVRSNIVRSGAACVLLGLAGPALAAQSAVADTVANPPAATLAAVPALAANTCLTDLQAFTGQMEKDGYWMAGDGYALGYPMGAGGYEMYDGYPRGGYMAMKGAGFPNARSGFEVRALITSAKILARHGEQDACETVLGTTRGLYADYLADMKNAGVPPIKTAAWRMQQLAIAQPVMSKAEGFRSSELLATEVRNPKNVSLGSVDDIIMDPATGKIAYLVIERGGFLGINQKHVPVPWASFKATPDVSLLVLDSDKPIMDGAPRVEANKFSANGGFEQESQKVDAYWKANPVSKASN